MSGITNLISKLSDSERKLLVRGSVLVFLALFWAFVYKPINQSIESKEKHLTEL
ncbi:MAG: type II secretion system protein M, partial [Xanthomonadales bacterium]|nr:type II secretion system protein M [Xanthomonadales bacterium]